MKKTHNIRRVPFGFQVNVTRAGKTVTKFFSTKEHGSEADTLVEAMEFRDNLIEELPPSLNQLGYRERCNSNTGRVGITETHVRRGQKFYPCFSVSARPRSGKVLNKKFYFSGRGSRELAFTNATRWRDEILSNRKLVARRQ